MRQDVNPKKDTDLRTNAEWQRAEHDAARVILANASDGELEPKEVQTVIHAAMLNAARLARLGFRDERDHSPTRGQIGRA